MKLRYEEPPQLSHAEVDEAIAHNNVELLVIAPISITLYDEDLEYGQTLCIALSSHQDPGVRGNSILGFGHLARRFGYLDEAAVKPLIMAGLADEHYSVRGHSHSASSDTEHFLGWNYSD
jgi:hypothetical protein